MAKDEIMLQGQKLIEKAMKIALEAHKGQSRRDGKTPYIVHPLEVATKFHSSILKAIALLHDVIEDCDIIPEDLFKQEIPKVVVDAVVLLTKLENEPYLDYILKIKTSVYATMVKIADIKNNYPTSHKSKQERYDMALYILMGGK